MSVETLETRAIRYELEVLIEAPREAVWKALTTETDAWWLPDFHMVGEGSVVTLDARAGGGLIEQREGGGSLLWFTVQMVSPGRSLDLVGHLGTEWGGPATTMMHVGLEDAEGGTRLVIRDALVGCVAESTASSLKDGWGQLFGALKAHAEKG